MPFDPTKKKKKKKPVIQDPVEEVDKLTEKTENLTGIIICEAHYPLKLVHPSR